MPPPTVLLSDYLAELRRLLHDPSDVYWSAADKIAYINQALKRRDLDTGGVRQLVTASLVAGTDSYTFSTLGQSQAFDVVSVALIFGQQRIMLAQMSYSELTAQFRPWTNYRDVPVAFARYGPNTVYIGPPPSQAYSTEWDLCCYSSSLSALTDPDSLPYPYTAPVAYFAAHLAKYNERQYDEAQEFAEQYAEQISVALNSRTGMMPSLSLRGR